jgi:N-acyl-D-aspartate/D-glutamate deacylase
VFGFGDRGEIAPGKRADVTVFDPATVAPGKLHRVRDFPADGERLVADEPSGVTHVLVNGTPIRIDGEPDADGVAARPGQLLRNAG